MRPEPRFSFTVCFIVSFSTMVKPSSSIDSGPSERVLVASLACLLAVPPRVSMLKLELASWRQWDSPWLVSEGLFPRRLCSTGGNEHANCVHCIIIIHPPTWVETGAVHRDSQFVSELLRAALRGCRRLAAASCIMHVDDTSDCRHLLALLAAWRGCRRW